MVGTVSGGNLQMLQNVPLLLGASNYNVWATKIQAYLNRENVFDTINVVSPATAVSTDATKKRIAQSKLILAVDDKILSQIEGMDDPKLIWEKLERNYASKSMYRKTSLIIEYTQIKLENFESIDEYIDKIETTHQKLVDIGKDLGRDFAACMMFAGLPAEYEPMHMTIESMLESEFTIEKIKN